MDSGRDRDGCRRRARVYCIIGWDAMVACRLAEGPNAIRRFAGACSYLPLPPSVRTLLPQDVGRFGVVHACTMSTLSHSDSLERLMGHSELIHVASKNLGCRMVSERQALISETVSQEQLLDTWAGVVLPEEPV
jgi:hypothetical protein